MTESSQLTRWQVFSQSWPIMLANAAAPVVGFVDTFVIGRYVGTTALAGIGLGAVIYGIVYWGFGFLRMSTAGLAAQADGAKDEAAVQAHLFRAVPMGVVIGLIVFVTQIILLGLAFKIFTANETIESSAAIYIQARLWGLPATLGTIALMGWFVGISRSQRALQMQIVLNIVNVILSLLFVVQFEWGLFGVGIASAVAEWCGFAAGLIVAAREIRVRGGLRKENLTKAVLLKASALKKLGVTNTNIFIRTMALTLGFSFFGNAAATQGEIFLAGNHILLQLITMSALILDGFAHTTEAVAGAAYGAKSRDRFDRAVRLTTEFSAIFGVITGATIYLLGPYLIDLITPDPLVRESARTYLPFCAMAPVVGFMAWQFDGVFIGVTRTKAMRNAGIAAVIIYIGLHYILEPKLGPSGIWLAFIAYYIARALTLAVAYPGIRRDLRSPYALLG